jgi:FixJ family two-component response regulator
MCLIFGIRKDMRKLWIQDSKWQERAKKSGALACLKKPSHEKALLDSVGRCRQQIGSNKTNKQEYR